MTTTTISINQRLGKCKTQQTNTSNKSKQLFNHSTNLLRAILREQLIQRNFNLIARLDHNACLTLEALGSLAH